MEDRYNLTEGSLLKKMWLFSIPIFLSFLLQGLYSAIDLWTVGRFALSEDVSAVSSGSYFMAVIESLFSGFSVGCTVELAQKLAQGDKDNASFLFASSVRIFLCMSAVVCALVFFLSPFIAHFMHIPPESEYRLVLYLRVSAFECIPFSLFILLSSVFKSLGNSKIPFLFIIVASVTNITLNYIFVYFFHIGTLGVALATLISEIISVTVAFLYIHKHHFPFRFKRGDLGVHKGFGKRLFLVGLPIALEEIFTEGSFVVIISFINTLGLNASAGVGIAGKILSFVMFIPLTFLETTALFVALALSRSDKGRAKKTLYIGLLGSAIIGVVVFILLEFLGHNISSIFSKYQEVIEASYEFLKAVSVECLILSLVYCFLGYFEGQEKSLFVLFVGLFSTLFVKVPYAYYETFVKGVPSIGSIALALEFAAITELVLCVVYYLIVRWKKEV